jgi:hypothetical protein
VRIRNFSFLAFHADVSHFVELVLPFLHRHYFIQSCPHVNKKRLPREELGVINL